MHYARRRLRPPFRSDSRAPLAARGPRWVVSVVVALMVVGSQLFGSAVVPAASAASASLPFDMPSTSVLRDSSKKVFAHYVPWFPLSLDNQQASSDYYTRNYLAINGEGGKYAKYGGKQRDRPFIRPVQSGDWRLKDMETEVRQAVSAGLDGFAVSITSFGTGQTPTAVKTLLRGANNADPAFGIMLRPNMIASGIADLSVDSFAANLADLASYPAAYRLADKRLVLSPFRAEVKSVSWWTQLLSTMKTKYGVDVAFWPVFLNEMTYGQAFSAITYGQGNWGERVATNNDPLLTMSTSKLGRVKAVRGRGDKWMQPVSLQDARPTQAIFDEAQNTLNLRNSWKIAIDSSSDMVQLPTWNDYAEGTQFAPSAKMGWAPLDINAYYLTWYKTGVAPKIVRDAVYLSHRTMAADAKPTSQSVLMKSRNGAKVYDRVEALTFLKSPGTVTITVGSKKYNCEVAAGVDTCLAPLAPGKVSVSVTRDSATVAQVASQHQVVSQPAVQDMDYVIAGSLRDGSSEAGSAETPKAPTPTTAPANPAAASKTVTVAPIADTYVNEGAPTNNSGVTSSLVSRGSPGATAHLRFRLPAAPQGTTLKSASLEYWVGTADHAESAQAHSLTIGSNSWSETSMTWKTRASVGTELVGTIRDAKVGNVAGRAGLDVAVLKGRLGQELTLAISSAGTDDLRIWSSEFAAQARRPRLVLTFG